MNSNSMKNTGKKLAWNSGGKLGFYDYPKLAYKLHIHEKPPGLCRELVMDFARPGDVILDPYCGSSAIGCQAIMYGCEYIGIEIDEKAFGVSLERLRALDSGVFKRRKHEISQDTLF